MFDKKENVGLEYYHPKQNEPQSSVMDSLDYDFSVARYPDSSPLKTFIDSYIIAVKNNLDINIFNCRFEKPVLASGLVNFYIYLKGISPLDLGIFYIIDGNHDLKKIFYEVMQNNKLPAINTNTKVQFILKDFEDNSKNRAIARASGDIRKEIKVLYPEVAEFSFMSCLYVFIYEDIHAKITADSMYLREIKEYCYNAVKKHDIDNVWNRDNFYIRVDNYKIYKEIGGYNYFNSDCMDEFMTV